MKTRFGEYPSRKVVGKLMVNRLGYTAEVWGVAFSSDGKPLASASNDQLVRIWDAALLKQAGDIRDETEQNKENVIGVTSTHAK